jgi:hypothetical protein
MRGSDISQRRPLSPLVACCAHQVQSGAWQHHAGLFSIDSPHAAVPGLSGPVSQITQSPRLEDYTFICSWLISISGRVVMGNGYLPAAPDQVGAAGHDAAARDRGSR